MQVNATIIAAQQAAREARAALLQPKTAAPAASFLAELKEQAPVSSEAKPASAPIQAQATPAPMRPGSLIDIRI